MIDACKQNKKSLAIGYRLQHDPNTQEYRRIVNNKLLGKVQKVDCAAGYRESRTDHWKQKKELMFPQTRLMYSFGFLRKTAG